MVDHGYTQQTSVTVAVGQSLNMVDRGYTQQTSVTVAVGQSLNMIDFKVFFTNKQE